MEYIHIDTFFQDSFMNWKFKRTEFIRNKNVL